MARLRTPTRFDSALGLLVLRAAAGGVLAYHGWLKVHAGYEGFEGFVRQLNLPAPSLIAHAVPYVELAGGLLLVVGLLTRVAAIVLAVEMGLTGFLVKLAKLHTGVIAGQGKGVGAEIDFVLLAAVIAIALIGPGAFAIDRGLRIEHEIDLREPARERELVPA